MFHSMKINRREIFLVILLVVLVSLVVHSSTSTSKWSPPALRWPEAGEKLISPGSWIVSEDSLDSPTFTYGKLYLEWNEDAVPETRILASTPGWTVFDRLYMLDGTFYIVSDANATDLPDRKYMVSTGKRIEPGKEQSRLASDRELKVITADQAAELFGSRADWIEGTTWICTDPNQFITHYYHFVAELMLGFWRAYSSLSPSDATALDPPSRLIFPNLIGSVQESKWRDYSHLNEFVFHAAFPSASVEVGQDWADRISLGVPYVLSRVVLADRSAAMLDPDYDASHRTAASAFKLPGTPFTNGHGAFWNPIRNAVVDVASVRSLPRTGKGAVITYISRQQWGRRMLRSEDHDALVAELYKLRDTYGYEVNIVAMSKLSRIEQIMLASRTTIMMGVHGNGLTSLLWMKPSPRATVMEFFYPGGFAHDYEWTARALGMAHIGFWNDTSFTYPDVKPVEYPEGFQGNSIPLDGSLVARRCIERLALDE